MATMGAKRKARVIQTFDGEAGIEDTEPEETLQVQTPVKFTRKPNKSSSLRKSINFTNDDLQGDGGALVSDVTVGGQTNNVPVVIRPSVSRSASTKQKRKPASSRLSFGSESIFAGDDATASTSQKPPSHRATESNAFKKKPLSLPSRLLAGEDDRPRYSKEYLSELQSSTPNTPQDLSTLTLDDDEAQLAMALDDPSELEGATIVHPEDTSTALTSKTPAATVLTSAQIREKKERRARLALQGTDGDYMALDGSDGSEDDRLPNKKKDSRLIAEDEDLGEGYDEFVEDGGLSLGRAAERKARLRRKKEMADLIASAEGADSDDNGAGENSDDSLDRQAEYEAAQRRKGMGVEALDAGDEELGGLDMIPKMRPLPDLKECLQRMKDLVQGLEDDVRQKRARIASLQREKEEVVRREEEVQDILNQAGAKYQAVLGSRPGAATVSPLPGVGMSIPPGLVPSVPVERGLESFGTTPTARPEDEDMT